MAAPLRPFLFLTMPKSLATPAPDTTLAESRPANAQLPGAGLPRRLAALVYDGFLLFGLLVVPLFIFAAFKYSGIQALPNEAVTHELPPIAPKLFLQTYWVFVIAGFYTYFWRKNGQTLGMQAWRLRLDSADGGRPSWKQCGLRLLIGPLSLLIGLLGYWWMLIDREGRTWHDRASGTRIVLLPKQGKHKNYA